MNCFGALFDLIHVQSFILSR